jgi:hypothetical protein
VSKDLVKRLRETTHIYQVDCELKMKCAARIEELEAILREVDQWVEDLGVYANPTYKPAPIFLKLREVLSGERNTRD